MAWSDAARAAALEARRRNAKGSVKSTMSKAKRLAAARKKARDTGYYGTPKRISREYADRYSTAASIAKRYPHLVGGNTIKPSVGSSKPRQSKVRVR